MGGSRITLLIQKTLYHSDLNPQQNRLSISPDHPLARYCPLRQKQNREALCAEADNIVLAGDFLLPTELEILEEKKGIKVKLIQPSLEITELTLIKWFMHKAQSQRKSNWVKVAKANNLEKDDVVQVCSFRVDEKLCMAIVKL
ncbi:hypothetical protein Ahy_B10g102713 [Arachis hypogaea]|uniref:TF-B3 domain-containing protein n=1 Tax=Arachis hypogaea TaxID=3818 RepID=A0A444X2F5_ARAHY|nr:hypothetical protein Ahy_B10g102713 [Arachis hypogaea]